MKKKAVFKVYQKMGEFDSEEKAIIRVGELTLYGPGEYVLREEEVFVESDVCPCCGIKFLPGVNS